MKFIANSNSEMEVQLRGTDGVLRGARMPMTNPSGVLGTDGGTTSWGAIVGDITDQTDLVDLIDSGGISTAPITSALEDDTVLMLRGGAYKTLDVALLQLYMNDMPVGLVAGTNATAAIQAKHDQLFALGGRGRTVRVPEGEYDLGMLLWHPSLSFQGAGRNATIFSAIANVPLLSFLRRTETAPGSDIWNTAVAVADRRAAFYIMARTFGTPATEAWMPTFKGFAYNGKKTTQSNNEVGCLYAEKGKNDPDYDTFSPDGDAKCYSAFLTDDLEIYGCSFTGVYAGADRQRAGVGNTRSLNHGIVTTGTVVTNAYGVDLHGNDSLILPGCGGGGCTKPAFHGGNISGFCVSQVNAWPGNLAANDCAVCIEVEDCNHFIITGGTCNGTLYAHTAVDSNNSGKPGTISGMTFPLADELHETGDASGSSSHLLAGEEFNAYIVVKGYKNVIISGSSRGHDKNFKALRYLSSATEGGLLRDDCSQTSEPGRAGHTAAIPFYFDDTATPNLRYSWWDPYTGKTHTNHNSLTDSVMGQGAKTISDDVVLHIGPSYTARMTPFFAIDPDTWSRTSGVGTFHTENDAVDWIAGHKFRIQDTSNAWVEGQFTVLTNTPATSPPRSVITYADARANAVSGDLVGNGIAACDLQAWSCESGVPAYASIALGGNVRYITLGTNGTGCVGWMLPERQAQIRAIGPVGTIIVDGGSIGGSVNDDGLSGDEAFDATLDFIHFLQPQCKSLWLGTPPPYGAVAVNSAIYAAGSVLVHRMQTLARKYPWVKIIPFGEALATRYGIVDSTELLSGLQPPNDLCTDGVHDQQGAAAAKGAIIGHCLERDFRPRYSLGGAYPDNRIVASGTDVGGRKHPNLLTGWFGAVSTNAASGTGISGTKPTAGTLTGTAWTGTATAISSVVVNPDGGSDWVVGFGSPTTSPTGTTAFTMAWTGGRSAGELLTAVNVAANQGKEIDIWVDCGVGSFEPGGVTYVDLALWLTTAADGEWRQASGLSSEGDYQAVEQNKAMMTGFDGRIRFPRTLLPAKTYTAATFRMTVKPTQGTTGRNLGARARVGPGFRLEVVETIE